MPRVNLLIADDVSLGKTVEAGLIVRELLLRRRIETIVVAAQASMLLQWQDELSQKFGLAFTIVDREHLLEIDERAASRPIRGVLVRGSSCRTAFFYRRSGPDPCSF